MFPLAFSEVHNYTKVVVKQPGLNSERSTRNSCWSFYTHAVSKIPEKNELHFDGFMLSRSAQSSNYFENIKYIRTYIFYRNAHISGVSLTMRNRKFLSEI